MPHPTSRLLSLFALTALAGAQRTTTWYTSTSWELLDNTDLFPKQTPTATSSTGSDSSDAGPTATTSSFSYEITPPISCPGLYYTYGGVCCAGNRMLDCSYSDIDAGYQNASSCCPAGEFVWALPLSDAQVAAARANGTYSGCPGNMRNGVCCSGGVIYEDDGAEVCSLGTVVFVASTMADGDVVTSSVPPEPTATSSEPAWYSALTAASKSSMTDGASATATGAAGGRRYGLGRRIWGGAVIALGAVL